MWVDIDDELIEEKMAVISVFDHGFLYGVGCFETLRTYSRHPFLFVDHMKRLKDSLTAFGIETAVIDDDLIRHRVDKLLDKNELDDGYIRISVSAGEAALGLPRHGYTKPRIIIMCKPLTPQQQKGEAVYKQLRICPIPRNTPESHLRLKSFQYGNNIMAAQQMKLGLTEEGLFLTKEGFVAEGLVSNVFFMKEGSLFTPSVQTGILDGITRQFVIAMAKKCGIQVVEGMFPLSELANATEVFLTNSVQELVPVTEIADVWKPETFSFPIMNRFLHIYRRYIGHLESVNQLEKEVFQ